MVFKSDGGRKELRNMMDKCDLVDVWRERNEGIREYSRQQLVRDFMCRSRIDFMSSKRESMEFILMELLLLQWNLFKIFYKNFL